MPSIIANVDERFVDLKNDLSRAAGYRGSDLVQWHRPEIGAAAVTESGIAREADAPERHLGGR